MRVDIPKTIETMKIQFSKLFSDIRIIEGSKQIYFSMSNYRSKMLSNIQLDLIIEKKDIDMNNVKWSYLANPKTKLVCEKFSVSDKLFSDVIKVMEFLEFDRKYLDSIQLIKEEIITLKPTPEQIAHMEWLKEAFSVRVGNSLAMTSSSAAGAGGGRKTPSQQGIDYDSINVTLVVY